MALDRQRARSELIKHVELIQRYSEPQSPKKTDIYIYVDANQDLGSRLWNYEKRVNHSVNSGS